MCGLFGIINTKPRSFDFTTFATLGIANDSRGGDSCGVFIDGQVDYGIDKEAFFVSHVLKSELITETTVAQIAMGHDRKASAGYKVNLAGAQPCTILDDDGNIIFCVTHNGTIHNADELAKKYIPEINVKDLTDSQIMTNIFFHVGYDCLEEYNGTAVFIIADYRSGEPEVFFYKGNSKENSYDAKTKDERPLFYTIDKSIGEIVYSSIPNYLIGLRPELTLYTLTPNTLLKFVGTGMQALRTINRDSCVQKKAYAVQTYTYQHAYQSTSSVASTASKSYAGDGYLEVDKKTNLYSARGVLLNGKSIVTRFGKLEYVKNAFNHELWFYNGICMLNEECWNFVRNLRESLGISNVSEFARDYENVIRYFSVYNAYRRGELWMQATSPIGFKVYTGHLRFLGYTSGMDIKDGAVVDSFAMGNVFTDDDYKFMVPDFDFEKLKEECKSLMK